MDINDELKKFAMLYINMVRDPAIKTFVQDLKEGKINLGDRKREEAFQSMTWEQRNAVYALMLMLIDTSMLFLLALTSQKFSPLSFVYRSQANEAGITGMTDAFDLDPQKLIDWMAEYSKFPYENENPWLKYGWPSEPGISLN